MDFFQEVKILSTSPPGGTLSWGLKYLKPEKIGLWAKFNRHIHVLVLKFVGAQKIWKVAVHWVAMTTPSIQYNTFYFN